MMISTRTQSGATHLVLLLALVVVAVAGFVGYRVWTNQNEDTDTTGSTASQTAVPETITDTKDLDQANSALEQASLDNDLNPAGLEQDVESLL